MGNWENIRTEVEDKIAVLTIDHPPANSFNTQVVTEFNDALDELLADDEVKHAETFAKMKKNTTPEMTETRILINARNVFEAMKEAGAEIKTDSSQIELYKKAKESGEPFNAVILDLTIRAGLGGKETIQKLIEIDPGVKGIVTSGYSSDPVLTDFKKFGFTGAIAKPFKMDELTKILHKV